MFQATPQLVLAVRQPSPQIEESRNRSKKADSAKAPSLSTSALLRMRLTGKKMNSPISSTMMPIEEVVKRIAPADAAIGQPVAEQQQQGDDGQERAEPHAGLRRLGAPQQRGQPGQAHGPSARSRSPARRTLRARTRPRASGRGRRRAHRARNSCSVATSKARPTERSQGAWPDSASAKPAAGLAERIARKPGRSCPGPSPRPDTRAPAHSRASRDTAPASWRHARNPSSPRSPPTVARLTSAGPSPRGPIWSAAGCAPPRSRISRNHSRSA